MVPKICLPKEDGSDFHKKCFVVYIDNILVFNKNKTEHLGHLQIVFSEFIKHGIIISKKKIELLKTIVKFLWLELGQGKIKLQPHNSQKILGILDKLEDLKILQKFFGLINYARPYIKDIDKIAGPLYSKTSLKG